jgi:hypothetical protein
MRPIILHQVTKARIADLHRQAERDRMARTARLARKAHSRHFVPGDLATILARRESHAVDFGAGRPPAERTGRPARPRERRTNIRARTERSVPLTRRNWPSTARA